MDGWKPLTMNAAHLQDAYPDHRHAFHIPSNSAIGASLANPEDPCIYMAGNSLGLQPKTAKDLIQQEMDVWSSRSVPPFPFPLPILSLTLYRRAVLGHFDHPHDRPWKSIDEKVTPALAAVVGAASESEVACTSTLTSNLHNLFVTFFRPKGNRTKILMEGKAFPSDQVSFPPPLLFFRLASH